MKRIIIILVIVLLLAATIYAAPIDRNLLIQLKPNQVVQVQCTGQYDRMIVEPLGDGEVLVTCRVWVNGEEND